MKKIVFPAAAVVALAFVSFSASSNDTVMMCHITDKVVDAANNKCMAIAVPVSPAGAANHADHGDPPAPAGTRAGQRFVATCQ